MPCESDFRLAVNFGLFMVEDKIVYLDSAADFRQSAAA